MRLEPLQFMSDEEQAALLGNLPSGGSEPLSREEVEAAQLGLGALPVQESVPPRPNFKQPPAPEPPPEPETPPTEEEQLAGAVNSKAHQYFQSHKKPATEEQQREWAQQPGGKAPAAPVQAQAPATPKPAAPAPVVAQTKGRESKLVKTGPEWFDYVAPPKIDGYLPAALQFGSGVLTALLSGNDKNALPLALGGLTDAAGTLIQAPQADYQNRLRAAKTQADMHKTLTSSTESDNLAAERLNLAREKFEAQKAAAERERLEREALQSMDSPQTQLERAAAIGMGMKPEEANKLNGDLLRRWRTSLAGAVRQDEGQTHRVANMETTHQNALTRMDHQDRLMRERAEEKRERDRVASLEEAAIPGIEWINPNRPPSKASVDKVREVHSARESLIDGATRLAQLQKQVKSVVHQGLGAWNKVFGDVEQADILQEMNFLREQLAADQRVIWNQGVPHEFDLRVNKKTNPEATNPLTFFTGEGAWGAMARTADRRADLILKSLNARRAGTETPKLDPAPPRRSASKKDLSDEVRKGGETAQRVVDEVKDAAGAVADKVKVQVFNPQTQQWTEKVYSREALETAKKKLAEATEGSKWWGWQIKVMP